MTSSVPSHKLQETSFITKCSYETLVLKMIAQKLDKPPTFQVIIERTLMIPSDPPKATRGPSPPADLERNSILQQPRKRKGQQIILWPKNDFRF